MNKAVIYARYSYSGQRDVSIDDQIREVREYAKRNDFEIIKIYADRAVSGRSAEKRKEFLKLISDSEKRAFSHVLVYKHDRFARNQYDSVIYKKRLKDNGVKVVAVAEPIPDGHGAKILESIYMAMAEEYSENLAENVKRGMYGNALKGMVNSKPPFGYSIDKNTHKFVLNEKEARLVKDVFDMLLAGKSQKEALEFLSKKGYKRSHNWVSYLIQNERYTGVYISGDVKIDGGMPQIISKEEFEKVRAMSKQRQKNPQAKPHRYLFSGLIYCGYCGAAMCGESAQSHTGKLYRYYTCPGQKKFKTCNKKRVPAEIIEPAAMQALKSVIFKDDVIERLANDLYKHLKANTDNTLKDLHDRLKTVEKSITNIINHMAKFENVPESMCVKLEALEFEKKELLSRIDAETINIDFSNLKKDDLKRFLKNFNQSDDRQLVDTFVTRLDVFDGYGVLSYDASGENTIKFNYEAPPDDFVHDTENVHQSGMCTKIQIKDGRLYIRFPLAA